MNQPPTISVSELVSAFKEVVESALPPVCVAAEISNCRRSAAGHYYLTLKDERAEIGAVIWRTTAGRLKNPPKDGMKVLAHGALQVYVARGSCQFIINRLQPQGVGELEQAFRRLKEKLENEGLFDPARKRPLPDLPRRIALVTSPTSAAVRDMIQVMKRRWPAVELIIVPVAVQGESAAPQIAAGLQAAGRLPRVDVIITGRGGGSLEDLWPFNEEAVARAIVDCPVPVVSAVGHEIDVSIADLVADRRALTPSEAGELVVPSAEEFRQDLRNQGSRLYRHLRGRIDFQRQLLQSLESRSVLQRPHSLVHDRRQLLDETTVRLQRGIQAATERLSLRLATLAASMDALSPLKVLSRGYSLTTDAEGNLLRDGSQLREGDLIRTRLGQGTVSSRVVEVSKADTVGRS